MTTTAIGKQLSERRPSQVDIERSADSVAEMLVTHLGKLGPRKARTASPASN